MLCKFHLAVMILSGVDLGLKFWHSESAVCDAIGCGGMSHLNQSDSVDLVCWCTCV